MPSELVDYLGDGPNEHWRCWGGPKGAMEAFIVKYGDDRWRIQLQAETGYASIPGDWSSAAEAVIVLQGWYEDDP